MTSTARPDARRPRRWTSSLPTTASRSPTSSPTSTSTTRRTSRRTATATTTTAPGTAAPRGRPETRRSWRFEPQQQRNMLATLLLSQGIPMLVAGDERGRTQGGNNNAWCQDNEVSWLDWDETDAASELAAFTRRLLALRKSHAVFRRTRFLDGGPAESVLPDAWWFRPDGRPMAQRDWHELRHLGVFLNGQETGPRHPRGRADRRRLVHRLRERRARAPRLQAPAAPVRPRMDARADDGPS